MSSHIFEEIEKTCDRAAIIREGHIVAVENMEKLRQSKRKVMEVRFDSAETASAFAQSMDKCTCKDTVVTAHVTGNMDQFIKALSAYTVKDMDIRTQSLEELFMHFYGGNK